MLLLSQSLHHIHWLFCRFHYVCTLVAAAVAVDIAVAIAIAIAIAIGVSAFALAKAFATLYVLCVLVFDYGFHSIMVDGFFGGRVQISANLHLVGIGGALRTQRYTFLRQLLYLAVDTNVFDFFLFVCLFWIKKCVHTFWTSECITNPFRNVVVAVGSAATPNSLSNHS